MRRRPGSDDPGTDSAYSESQSSAANRNATTAAMKRARPLSRGRHPTSQSAGISNAQNARTTFPVSDLELRSLRDLRPQLPAFTPRTIEKKHDSKTDAAELAYDTESIAAPGLRALQSLLRQMPMVQLVRRANGATSDEAIHADLRQRRIELPLIESGLADKLLQEAGTFMTTSGRRTFPPCAMDRNCIMRTVRLMGMQSDTRVTLTATMFKEEYEALIKHGIQPSARRCCILCDRYNMTRLVHTARAQGQDGVQLDTTTSVQFYRVLVGEKGGYIKEACIMPSTKAFDGLFDPVVSFDSTHLSAYRDASQGGRWVIKQDPIVVKDTIRPPRALFGESVVTFRRRIKRVEAQDAMSDRGRCVRVRASIHQFLNWSLVRDKHSTPQGVNMPSPGCTDARQLHQWYDRLVAQLRTVADHERWVVHRAIDMCSSSPYWRKIPEEFKTCRHRRLVASFAFTLSDMPIYMDGILHSVPLWDPPRTGTPVRLRHLIGKAINFRCQVRMGPAIIRRFCINNSPGRTFISHVVVSALCGTDPWVTPGHELSPDCRLMLKIFAICEPERLHRTIMCTEHLAEIAIRYMAVQTIRSDPALYSVVCDRIQWTNYESVVNNFWTDIRRIVKSAGVSGMIGTDEGMLFTDSVRSDINARINRFRSREVSPTQVQRPRVPLLAILSTRAPGIKRSAKNMSRFVISVDEPGPRSVRGDVLKTMVAASRRFNTDWTVLQDDVLPLLRFVGVAPAAIAELQALCRMHDHNYTRPATIGSRLRALDAAFPYSLYVLRVMTVIWHEHRATSIITLPAHHLLGQLRAVREKLGIDVGSNVIPKPSIMLYFCHGCRSHYSLVKPPIPQRQIITSQPVDTTHSIGRVLSSPRHATSIVTRMITDTRWEVARMAYATLYPGIGRLRTCLKRRKMGVLSELTHGLPGCAIDVMSVDCHRSLYCANDDTGILRSCQDRPLDEILLAGFLVVLHHKVFFLCCGPKCGSVGVYHPDSCMYTRDGYLCAACTRRNEVEKNGRHRRVDGVPVTGTVKCDVCHHKVTDLSTAVIFPFGVVVCHKDNSDGLRATLRHKDKLRKLKDRDAVINAVKEYTEESAHVKKKLFARHNRRVLNASKRWFRQSRRR